MASDVIEPATVAQFADRDAGDSPNSENQHSHRTASVPTHILDQGRQTNGRLVRENERALRKLRYRASEERSPIKLAKINKNIAIKVAFIAKLKSQYNDVHQQTVTTGSTRRGTKARRRALKFWDWEQVETIPGEFEWS
jgi:hypothetical protein